MVTSDSARKITDEEFYYAEDAFIEFMKYGCSERKCPWCGGKLKFEDLGSGHIICCSDCKFKATVRGL